MFSVTGRVLEVVSERVTPKPGQTWSAFDSITWRLLVGKADVVEVRPTTAFPGDQHPKEGETVTLDVDVQAYRTAGGADYRLVCSRRVPASATRPVAAAG